MAASADSWLIGGSGSLMSRHSGLRRAGRVPTSMFGVRGASSECQCAHIVCTCAIERSGVCARRVGTRTARPTSVSTVEVRTPSLIRFLFIGTVRTRTGG